MDRRIRKAMLKGHSVNPTGVNTNISALCNVGADRSDKDQLVSTKAVSKYFEVICYFANLTN